MKEVLFIVFVLAFGPYALGYAIHDIVGADEKSLTDDNN